MALNKAGSDGDRSSDLPTNFTPSTMCDYHTANETEQYVPGPSCDSSVPWPGFTYIIRHVSTGKVLTFRRGKVILAPLDDHSAILWELSEKDGWFGLRDVASYMYLGYDEHGDIRCISSQHQAWEYFCIRHRPDGGYLLLMYNDGYLVNKVWKGLCPVGIEIKTEEGFENLAVIKDWSSDSIVWEFVKVKVSKD